MEFRHPTEAERAQVENLWAYCFEPKGHPFFEWYFANCYEPENILVGVEGDTVAADVHLRQLKLNVRGEVLPATYIVGVATHPAARRGGVGGELLKASIEELHARGQALTILMPSKAGFYQQYGWELYCHQWVQSMSLESLRPLTDKTLSFELLTSSGQWGRIAPVYEAYVGELSGHAVRDEAHWRRLMDSWFNEGAHVSVVKSESGDIEGYLVYSLGAPEIFVSEFVALTPRARGGLLNYIYNHRSQGESVRWNVGLHEASYLFQPDGKSGHATLPFMMSRIVDVETALREIPAQAVCDTAVSFRVSDPLIERNNGVFLSIYDADGAVVISENEDMADDGTEGGQGAVEMLDVETDIGALGLLLMGRLSAGQLRYEGRLAASDEAVRVLDVLYPKRDTYINEWW